MRIILSIEIPTSFDHRTKLMGSEIIEVKEPNFEDLHQCKSIEEGVIGNRHYCDINWHNGFTNRQFNVISITYYDKSAKSCPMDDGAGVSGSDKGQVQSDGQVQQGDSGQGSRSGDVTERPGCDGKSFNVKFDNEWYGKPPGP